MKLKNFKNKLIAFLIMLLGFVISSFAQNSNCHPNVCQDFGNTDLLQVYEAVKEQSAATITVTAGQTFVDSIALGVTDGNNQSNNAKETTLNFVYGALTSTLTTNVNNFPKAINPANSSAYSLAQWDSLFAVYMLDLITYNAATSNNSNDIQTILGFPYSTPSNANNILHYDSLIYENTNVINNDLNSYFLNSQSGIPAGTSLGDNFNRIHFQSFKQGATTTQTVTTPATVCGTCVALYVKTIIIQVVNTSTTTAFSGSIADGNTVVIPINVAPTLSGLTQSNTYYLTSTFEEPLIFQTSLRFIVISGACTYNVTAIGWSQ